METAGRAAVGTPSAPVTSGDEVVRHAPDGLAVIDAHARFVDANPAAVPCAAWIRTPSPGAPSPFPLPDDAASGGRAGEQTVAWQPAAGQRREFAYVLAPVPGRPLWIVSFRDVTLSRLRERRLAAIAKAASDVASKRSLVGTLEALAQEVRAHRRPRRRPGPDASTRRATGCTSWAPPASAARSTSSTSSWSAVPSAPA